MPAITSLARPTSRLLLLALVAALTSAPALAVDSSSADDATPADAPILVEPESPEALRNIRIVGSALNPRVSGVTYATNGSGGCVYATASPSSVWNTPLFLPEGSNVTTLRVYYDDTSASDLFAWFTVYDLYGQIVQEWSATSVGATGLGFNDSALINHVVNYNLYSYVVNYRPVATGATLQFCGVRIFYDY